MHIRTAAAVSLVFVLELYFLASAASSAFSTVIYVYTYFRFRGCPVVLDIELSVSAWYHKTRRVLLLAMRLLLLPLLTAESKERRLAVCGITFKLTSNGAEIKITISCQSAHQKIPPHP